MNRLFPIVLALLFFSCDESNPAGSVSSSAPEISIHNNGDIYISIYDYPEIAGFQFTLHTVGGDLIINSINPFGGLAEENGFTLSSSSGTGIVLGFSFTGALIEASPQNSNVLLYLDLGTTGTGMLGIEDVILSGENGDEIEVQVNQNLISVP